jgi:carbonic anhydrase/acetyltransferase-like protein (isoleucine patch superfamily)
MPDGRLKEADDWGVTGVRVEAGASIGAGVIVLPGITIGSWALVGAGATVTRDVAAHCLVAGNPARYCGWICRCARPIEPGSTCPTCNYRYVLRSGELIEEQT